MQVKKSCNNVSQGISSSGKLHPNEYQQILNSKLGEVATAVRKGANSHDHLTILEKDTCYTVEHLLWEISKDNAFLLKMGVLIIAKVTELRQGSDVPQGKANHALGYKRKSRECRLKAQRYLEMTFQHKTNLVT